MMKKFAIIIFAAILCAAFVVPAMALENEFGGYWDMRAYLQKDFSGDDSGVYDIQAVESRTRLYYTAILNENLKLVNKFEMDNFYGDSTVNSEGKGFGGIGADGTRFEIKNSYADFNLGPVNAKIGAQGATVARGFLFCDDFSGVTLTYKAGNVTVPFYWMKNNEGSTGNDANDMDRDYYVISPVIKMGDISLNPYVFADLQKDDGTGVETNNYYVGLDFDAQMGPTALWASAIYQTGDVDYNGSTIDNAAYLVALGGSMDMGQIGGHGQIVYASGDDDANDTDNNAFTPPTGRSYYWSEIMGYGDLGDRHGTNWYSNGSPADGISDVMFANLGATMKMNDKLKFGADIWYAMLAEDNANGDKDLGTEIDLKLSYELIEGLDLDVIGAYLFAGDATTGGVSNDANPMEAGTVLHLSF